MYIGSTGERGLHHLVYEVVDNSVDEALAGYCDTILVRILPEGGIQVIDNGRGIPVKEHPEGEDPGGHPGPDRAARRRQVRRRRLQGLRRPARRRRLGGQRAVGQRLNVEVKRDGYRWSQDFILGDPVAPLERHEATDETGTTVTFYASPDIFETTVYSYDTLATRFREMAFLNKGLTITIVDERPDRHGRATATPTPTRSATTTA